MARRGIKGFLDREIERTRADLSQLDDRAHLISLPGEGDLSTTVLLGNSSNAEFFARQLGPHLNQYGPSHFVVYPQIGFSTESIRDNYLQSIEHAEDRRKATVFFSMGQMVFNYLMTQPDVLGKVGTLDYAIGHSGVTRISDLQMRTRILLRIGTSIAPSHLGTKLYSSIKLRGAMKRQPHPDIPHETQRDFHLSNAMTSLYTEYGQWNFLRRVEELPAGALAQAAKHMLVKRVISAPKDSTVNRIKSFNHMRELYDDGTGNGGGWIQIVSDRLPYDSHALGALYPSDITDVLDIPSPEFKESA